MRRDMIIAALLVPGLMACDSLTPNLGSFSRSIIMFQPENETSSNEVALEHMMSDYKTYIESELESRVLDEYRLLFFGLLVEFGTKVSSQVEAAIRREGNGLQRENIQSALTDLLVDYRRSELQLQKIDLILDEDGVVHAISGTL